MTLAPVLDLVDGGVLLDEGLELLDDRGGLFLGLAGIDDLDDLILVLDLCHAFAPPYGLWSALGRQGYADQ